MLGYFNRFTYYTVHKLFIYEDGVGKHVIHPKAVKASPIISCYRKEKDMKKK